MTDLEHRLETLAEPPLPEGLAAGVTARIARLDSAGHQARTTSVRTAEVASSHSVGAHLAWLAAIAGLVLALGAQAYRFLAGEATLDLISPRAGGLRGVVEAAPASPAVAIFALGLFLYVVGLLATLREREGVS